MKLTTSEIAGFLQKPPAGMQVILFYGPDAGLVRERADALAKKTVTDPNDPFRVAALTGDVVANDPARLPDEMNAVSFGGGKRLVRLQQAIESNALPLNDFIESKSSCDSLLIIEAGDLEKRSKLRAICENASIAAAIPCYVEEGAAKQRIITEILGVEKINASRDVTAFLSEVLPPDRIAMRSELEKLALYAKGKASVTMEDVLAVVQDAGAAELDDLIFAVGAGESKKAARMLDRLFAEQTSPVALLRAAQRHFIRLQWARGQMDKGSSADDALRKLQPPVFWKYADSMTGQLRRWPSTKIEKALQRLFEAEAAVKRTGSPDQALTAQLLLGLAA